MKKILLFLLVCTSLVIAQRQSQPIWLEVNHFSNQSSAECFVSFKIPFNNLVFVKDKNVFTGGITLTLEALIDENIVGRESVSKTISLNNYDETNSKILFLEGVLKITLPQGKINLIPEVSLLNTERSIKLSPLEVEINQDSILKPIVVDNSTVECKNSLYRLVNYGSVIPYSADDYSLIFAILENDLIQPQIEIYQNDSLIVKRQLETIASTPISITDCDNMVVLTEAKAGQNYNIFKLNNFSTKLEEGKVKVVVISDSLKKEFNLNVIWPGKPRSLYNAEFAIELLEYITDYETVDELLSYPKEEYYKKLIEFWNTYSPKRKVSYNKMMYEFYKRVDYAILNFASVNNRNGSETDRGKIYIKYGKPDKIEREYSELNDITEIWIYKKINKKFIFTDKSGLGNYILVK